MGPGDRKGWRLTSKKPAVQVKQVAQVCVVVKDLQKSMERYWDILGIGPWRVYTYGRPHLTSITEGGKQQSYSWRLALAEVGAVQWELIQPLQGPSPFMKFLTEKGEGVHHIAVGTDDYDQTVAALAKEGAGIVMSGTHESGTIFTYMDTQKSHGVLLELITRPKGWVRPPPEALWPPDAVWPPRA